MSVGLLDIFLRVEEASEEDIAGAFPVHDLHLDSVEHANTEFEFFSWLFSDVPQLNLIRLHRQGVNLSPALDNTLADRSRRMVDLSVFNRLLLKRLPLHGEVPVFKIEDGGSDQVVAEDLVVVVNVDAEGRAPREGAFEVIVLIEVGVGVVQLVVVAFVVSFVVAREVQVRITGGSIISGAEVIGRDHVNTHNTLSLSQQSSLQDFVRLQVSQVVGDVEVVHVDLSHFDIELAALHSRAHGFDVDFDFFTDSLGRDLLD
mmetsp:Transcript_30294/g.46315  ORF Transcript_30294/g.46315 Transcript_30294/m.46315 type:complete len:259 (-) Transcript_30294:3601-4377(-)